MPMRKLKFATARKRTAPPIARPPAHESRSNLQNTSSMLMSVTGIMQKFFRGLVWQLRMTNRHFSHFSEMFLL